jgi:hypothetical protein
VGAVLKLAYLRIYFNAHGSHGNARAASVIAGVYLGGAMSTVVGAMVGAMLDYNALGMLLVGLPAVLAGLGIPIAYLSSWALLVAAARTARLSRVEWWLSEAALPDHDWAALVWHGLESAEIYRPDGGRERFPSAFDAINWLSSQSYVDRATALTRKLVGANEIPPELV